MIQGDYGWALIVFIGAGVSDSLDGLIARLSNQRTRLGAYLDPAADKLLLAAGFITLALLDLIPSWLAVLVVSRDILLVLGTFMIHWIQGRQEISPSQWGKAATAIQMLYVGLILLCSVLSIETVWTEPVLVLMVGITVFSCVHYIHRGVQTMNPRNGGRMLKNKLAAPNFENPPHD